MSRIKICGLFRPEDIEYANAVQPDYIGFVFAESRRRVTAAQAVVLRKSLREGIQAVGVFVNADADQIVALAGDKVIDLVQLHGQEDDRYIADLKKRMDLPVIKAVNMAAFLEENSPSQLNQRWPKADYLLLDNGPGGTGTAFDWKTVGKMERPWFLAGGIDVSNVKDALKLNPFAIDVSSGAETDGVKDPEKMRMLATSVGRQGRFGDFGGRYLPETLMNEIIKLEKAWRNSQTDSAFQQELNRLLCQYAGRPSPLYFAEKLTGVLGGARIYLKREDMNHTGSHKINNVLGQTLLAKKMGKTRVIAETGAGQHGVAAATAAALLDMECEVFMGEEDMERQALNVYRMKLLGARVNGVSSGTRTLKDAVNETMREWVRRSDDTHYVLGSVMGPHPFPEMVRDFQSVISLEARAQILDAEGKLPAAVLACVGGGSNAIGVFWHFIPDIGVDLIGCEAAGDGIDTPRHAATMTKGETGVFHGMKSYFCQDDQGQIAPVYSISAGLDYPGIGPEHAWLRDAGRAKYVPVTDEEAVSAFEFLAKTEGVICAVESAHAVAHARKLAPAMDKDSSVIICLSGRGDKDVAAIARYRGVHIDE